MAKINRRVQRTRQQLHAALRELIYEAEYGQITVQHITDRAKLSRATFYLHYTDKNHLFMAIMLDNIKKLVEQYEAWDGRELLANPRPLRIVFREVQAEQKLYRVLFCDEDTAALMPPILKAASEGIEFIHRQSINEEELTQIKVPLSLICDHMAHGIISAIKWWLENGCQQSAEYMADLSRQLTMFGALPFMMGVSEPVVIPLKPV